MPFKKRFNAPKGHSFNARYFDRYFLTSLDKEQWKEMAEKLASEMTDEMIDSALLTMPEEVQRLRSEEFSKKLKNSLTQVPQ